MVDDLEAAIAAFRELASHQRTAGDQAPATGRSARTLLVRLRQTLLGRRPRTRLEDRLFEEELRVLLLEALPAQTPRSLALWLARPGVRRELTSSPSPVTGRLDLLLGPLSARDKPAFAAALDLAGLSLAEARLLGAPLLHHAAKMDDADLALLLLERGVAPGSRDDRGRTAMHAAAEGLSPRCTRLLAMWGVSLTALSDCGDSPLAALARKAALSRSAAADPRLVDLARALVPSCPSDADAEGGLIPSLVQLLRRGQGQVPDWAVGELAKLPSCRWDRSAVEAAVFELVRSQRLSLALRLLRLVEPPFACGLLWRSVAMAAQRGLVDLASAMAVHLSGSLSPDRAEPSTVTAMATALCRAVLSGSSALTRRLIQAAGASAAAASRCFVPLGDGEGLPPLSPETLCCLLDDPQQLRTLLTPLRGATTLPHEETAVASGITLVAACAISQWRQCLRVLRQELGEEWLARGLASSAGEKHLVHLRLH